MFTGGFEKMSRSRLKYWLRTMGKGFETSQKKLNILVIGNSKPTKKKN